MNQTQETRRQSLTSWRDSVHAGDDVDAPHEIRLPISDDESLENVIRRIVSSNYLASISGGKATWIVESGSRALGVVAQQWPTARFLVAADNNVRSFLSSNTGCHLNFIYWCQVDPDHVFECLQDGKPLPNKYG